MVYAQIWMVIFGKFTIRRRPLFCAYSSEKNLDFLCTKQWALAYKFGPPHNIYQVTQVLYMGCTLAIGASLPFHPSYRLI